MFIEARIKLTAWYLAIIMAISIFFSVIIYRGATFEIDRIQRIQILRHPLGATYVLDSDVLRETKQRIVLWLVMINSSIFIISAIAGYFLAGKTLEPIRTNVENQKKFISDSSHELRTPLTSLKTEIEVALRDKKLSLSNAKVQLKSNLEDVNKMQRLANYLLKLNVYEDGQKLPMTKVDLKEIALDAVGKRKIKTNLKKSIVAGNKDSLTELLTILIDNAIKYGEGKEVEVRVKPKGVVEIEDHGIGISDEDLPHIFDRFYRSDKSRGTDGYGLGLSIAKSIVDLHHGTIKVESKLGQGSKFTVLI